MTYRDDTDSLRARVAELEGQLAAATTAAAAQSTAHQIELATLRRAMQPTTSPPPPPVRRPWAIPLFMTLLAAASVAYYAGWRASSPPAHVWPGAAQ